MMKKMLKNLIALTCVFMLIAAALPAIAEDVSGKITFTHYKNGSADEIEAMVAEYVTQNAGATIDVEIETDDNIVRTLFASNELPDIIFIPKASGVDSSNFSEYFLPIDDIGFTAENTLALDGGMGDDGKLYAVPVGVMYRCVLYNKTVFASAGVEVPKTADEFFAVCKTLKEAGIQPLALLYTNETYNMGKLMEGFADAQLGVANYRNTIVGQQNPFTQEVLGAVELNRQAYLQGYCEEDPYTYTFDDACNDFVNNKLGMVIMADWMISSLTNLGMAESDIGLFPIPDSKAILITPDCYFGISAKSSSPELAKDFLYWAWTEGNLATLAGLCSPMTNGAMPSGVQELLTYASDECPILSAETDGAEFNAKKNEAEIDFHGFARDYVIAEDPQPIVDQLNNAWNAVQ